MDDLAVDDEYLPGGQFTQEEDCVAPLAPEPYLPATQAVH